MSKQLGKHFIRVALKLKQPLGRKYQELIVAFTVAACILLLRSMGILQSLELAGLDQFFRFRHNEPSDDRITIVAIDEAALHRAGSWPIPDSIIAQLLQKIRNHQPRAVGLDIYRDLVVNPGHEELAKTYHSMPNLVGIQLLTNNPNTRVLPPLNLSPNQAGFNNILYDIDGKVRRNLLYLHLNNQRYESFALKLALLYLKKEGIKPKKAPNNSDYLKLGKAIFTRFQGNDGGYVRTDDKGYQILANFPKPECEKPHQEFCSYRTVSMSDVLDDKVPISWIRDRIVLIGSTAPSLQDFVFIPYSNTMLKAAQPVAGIELQAYFISELISSALTGRPLLKVWPKFCENLGILACAYIGSAIICRSKSFRKSFPRLFLGLLILIIISYLAFLAGWWLPVIPGLLSFSCVSGWMIFRIAYMQEELKRSREFLHQVINSIPDPIFVKNEQHKWIVLNDAYCKFIGYPDNVLLDKSYYEFFPKHEADIFHQQDQLVFFTQKAQENEEEFTDAAGKTHLIATKRSLHKDAAGNIFLVGVIRDITQRKLIEEELKRTAAELFRSNTELKLKEDNLRYLAYHDPLTGLSNRKFFAEQLYESLNWAENNNLLLGLLFIDLDGFKQVNDTLGHDMGDRLLVIVAQRLSNCLRGSDTVSRLGGDEFTVILRAIPNVQVAARVATKILASITEPIVLAGYTTKISASIGISIYPVNSQDSESLIKQADAAMYRAKHLGKNRYELA
ncbi:CHASE2 domain-containing protein [Nostoc sp. FACHB-110]|uniref:CHASE2 domain-containing protein n=1 Tax=Nostoc sp. FACHB-110 TaxID=2692834 RepID=UPI001684FF36|nr:CHASE2 domain-containing protein [Nostoc sp. FACHB-110]MBD2436168.1 CHASE2 domain-containing protein [Nostoc sp. FACHB-110]